MAVTADDLTFPVGRLNPALLWPGQSEDTTNGYLDAFLLAGVAKTASWDTEEQDAGTKAWAEYKGLDSFLRDRLMQASTVAFADEGSASWTADQLRMLEADRDAALLEFTELEDTATADDPLAFTTLRSLRD